MNDTCFLFTMGGKIGLPTIPSRVSQRDKAILKIKILRDKIKNHQKRLEQELQCDQQLARQLLRKGNRDKAKCLLRRKFMLEKQLSNADDHLAQLECVIHQLQYSELQERVIHALNIGNEALKKVHQLMDVKKVNAIIHETVKGIRKQAEINRLVSGIALTVEEENELETKLENILQQMINLPTAPSHDPGPSNVTRDEPFHNKKLHKTEAPNQITEYT